MITDAIRRPPAPPARNQRSSRQRRGESAPAEEPAEVSLGPTRHPPVVGPAAIAWVRLGLPLRVRWFDWIQARAAEDRRRVERILLLALRLHQRDEPCVERSLRIACRRLAADWSLPDER